MEDRRRSYRLNAWLHAYYRIAGSEQPFNAMTRNVGAGGVALLTERRLECGTPLQVEVKFSDREPITFTAAVAWSEALIRPGMGDQPRAFETGLRFVDITPENRKQILLFTVLSPPPSTIK